MTLTWGVEDYQGTSLERIEENKQELKTVTTAMLTSIL